VNLSEITSIDADFASAIKMFLIRASLDGKDSLPMEELVGMLSKLGFQANGQETGIRNYITTLKGKNPDLVSDVNDTEIILTTIVSDPGDAEDNEEKVGDMALSNAKADLGI